MEFSFNLWVESGNRQLELSRIWNDFAMLTQFLSAPAAVFLHRRAGGECSQGDFGVQACTLQEFAITGWEKGFSF
jgi:hypothetical protein